MFRKLIAFAVATVVTAGMAAESVQARSLDDILKAGVIRIGVQPNLHRTASSSPMGAGRGWTSRWGRK